MPIYREAARLIAENEWDRSCWAILQAEGRYDTQDFRSVNCDAYVELMLDGVDSTDLLPWWDGDPNGEQAQAVRVLLLCFMAAAVEAGDA